MKKGFLSEYFEDVAIKRLSKVESDPQVSNQHELNGVSTLKEIFGENKKQFTTKFVFLEDEEGNTFIDTEGMTTWYDARKHHPTRSEFRFYLSSNYLFQEYEEDDLVVVGKMTDGTIMLIAAKEGSTSERQLMWLFDIDENLGTNFKVKQVAADDMKLNFAGKIILEELGIEIKEEAVDFLEKILEKFGGSFPSTKEFSLFARQTCKDIDPKIDLADTILLTWMDWEETLFRTLENHIVSKHLKKGFRDVDEFVKLSLSVQNRRKSRMGHAFENHVEEILKARNVKHVRGKITENKSKPDFLFPDINSYHDDSFPAKNLFMLGCKSTCKDRWRQVLTEAQRIKQKHLLTLQPGISNAQTDEMRAHKLQLVLPTSLHETYKENQRKWLMSFEDFIKMVKSRQ